MPTSPLFFQQFDDFIHQIPSITSSHSLVEHSLSSINNASPLLRDYLTFYGIDFFEYAQRYSIGQSHIDGFRIVEHYWQAQKPANKTLFLCHGYLDHTGLYSRMILWGLRNGYNVHSFDLPGHGLSGGEPAAIVSFDQYSAVLAHILNREQEQHFALVGQSTGCSAVINYLLKPKQFNHQSKPDKVVLLAPLVRSRAWSMMRWSLYILGPFLHSIKRSNRPSSHNQDSAAFIQYQDPLQSNRIPTSWLSAMDQFYKQLRIDDNPALHKVQQPQVLLVQGDNDGVVDYSYNLKRLQCYIANLRVDWIAGAEHRLVNETEHYWQPVVAALDDYFKTP